MDFLHRNVQHDGDDEERHDTNGNVDVEDPAPRHVLGEPSTSEWAEDARKTKHRTEVTHIAATLARRDDVTSNRLRADHQATGTRALEGTANDELQHVLRQTREHGSNEEDDDRQLEELLAPVKV